MINFYGEEYVEILKLIEDSFKKGAQYGIELGNDEPDIFRAWLNYKLEEGL